MTSPVHHLENSASAGLEETAPCSSCGAALSRYVSKCPSCGHHAHRYSQDEINARREFRQKLLLFVTAVSIATLIFLFALALRYSNSV